MTTIVPTKHEHIRLIDINMRDLTLVSGPYIHEHHRGEVALIGSSLCALYQAGTCHRKCHGGGHILESLICRSYNLTCGAYSLICSGLYDESLNLTRSLGEISNLIMMSIVDEKKLTEWIVSDKDKRIRDFGPAKVRKIIGDKAIMDGGWYASLCEKYVHITPQTQPNKHGVGELGTCGGKLQPKGIEESIGQLAEMSSALALMACKYFDFPDLFAEITNHITQQGD